MEFLVLLKFEHPECHGGKETNHTQRPLLQGCLQLEYHTLFRKTYYRQNTLKEWIGMLAT